MSSDIIQLNTMSLDERMQLQYRLEQFLYFEADLLDKKRFDEWLALLSEDFHYWMPVRRTTFGRDQEAEFTKLGQMAFFDDDLAFMTLRIKKMTAKTGWSEEPPSRTRHYISNIRILERQGDELTVELNFHLYRTRLESEEDSWRGRRVDGLRITEDGFLLTRRHIFLEQTVILSQNMSNIF